MSHLHRRCVIYRRPRVIITWKTPSGENWMAWYSQRCTIRKLSRNDARTFTKVDIILGVPVGTTAVISRVWRVMRMTDSMNRDVRDAELWHVWQHDSMTRWQCGSMTSWQYDSLISCQDSTEKYRSFEKMASMTVWQYDTMTVWQYDIVSIWQSDIVSGFDRTNVTRDRDWNWWRIERWWQIRVSVFRVTELCCDNR